MENKLIVTAAPHITSPDSTQSIMGRVCLALAPALIASVIIFGINALILTAVTVAACVFFEWAYCKLMGREVPIADFSAVVTGLLLAFNLPATLPPWMAITSPTPLSWAASLWPWASEPRWPPTPCLTTAWTP